MDKFFGNANYQGLLSRVALYSKEDKLGVKIFLTKLTLGHDYFISEFRHTFKEKISILRKYL